MGYDFGIIDGNFFLRRNFSAAKYSNTLLDAGASGLVKTFLFTVFNYQQTFDLKRIIIAWDKLPYKKLATISEYKADRHYACQEDIDRLNKLIEESAGKPADDLIAERDKIKYELECECIFRDAKNSLLTNINSRKILNVRVEGYEADDIAYLASKHLASQGYKCLLISTDSDWMTFVRNNVDFYKEVQHRTKKQGTLYTEELGNVPEVENATKLGCTLYEIGNLKEVYTGGHNNVSKYKHKGINFSSFAKAIQNNDTSLPEYDYFKERVKALNINSYDNTDLLNTVDNLLEQEINDTHLKAFLKDLYASLLYKYNHWSSTEPELIGGFVLQ